MKALLPFVFALTCIARIGASPLVGAVNDTCATATPLGQGTYSGLQLHTTWSGGWITDEDWYRFTVPPGFAISASVNVTGVVDSSGAGYGISWGMYEYSPTTCAGFTVPSPAFVTNTTAAPKDYVFKTSAFSVASQADLLVTYTLTIQMQGSMATIPSCPGGVNSDGVMATLQVTGSTSVGSNNVLFVAGNIPGNTLIMLASGTALTSVPFGDGTLCIGGSMRRLRLLTGGGPVIPILLNNATLPPSAVFAAGDLRYFQVYYRDAVSPGAGFNLTNPAVILFTP